MNPDLLSNPQKTKSYHLTWQELKETLRSVVSNFPSEYKLIAQEEDKLRILHTPLVRDPSLTGQDQIIEVVPEAHNIVRYTLINQDGSMASFAERDRAVASLELFLTIVEHATRGKGLPNKEPANPHSATGSNGSTVKQ